MGYFESCKLGRNQVLINVFQEIWVSLFINQRMIMSRTNILCGNFYERTGNDSEIRSSTSAHLYRYSPVFMVINILLIGNL